MMAKLYLKVDLSLLCLLADEMEENIAALNTQRYDVPYPVLEVPGMIICNNIRLLETK